MRKSIDDAPTARPDAAEPRIDVRSLVPGRVRFSLPVLVGRDAWAASIRQTLIADPEITDVVANPVTGRVLVVYSEELDVAEIETRLRRTFEAALAQPETSARWQGPLSDPLQQLGRWLRRFEKRVVLATVTSAVQKIFNLGPPLFIGAAVSVVVRGPIGALTALGVTTVTGQLWALVLLNAATWTLAALLEYAQSVLWKNIAQAVQHEVRLEAFRHVTTLDLAYVENERTGRLVSLLNDDVNQLERFLSSTADELIRVAATVVFVMGLFFWYAPGAGLLIAFLMPALFVFAHRFQSRIAGRYTEVRESAALISDRLSSAIGGLETVKAFTAERYESERLRELGRRHVRNHADAVEVSAAFVPAIRMFVLLGFSAVLLIGGHLTVAGTLPLGVFSAMIFLSQRFLWTLTYVGDRVDDFQTAMAAVRRIQALLRTQPTIAGGVVALALPPGGADITYDRVRFAYRSSPPVFDGLSLVVEKGKTTAIVGSTGAGKTTLVRLLLRFHDVGEGAVRIGESDVRELDLASLRRAIGFVSQDVVLFHGTVAENIDYGVRQPDLARVEQAARTAEAHEFIERLPEGYATIIGERGVTLSGGQRQRLAIARAILKDPPVLVFDEATASVDNETELAIRHALEQLAVGRTMLIIAHRLSTVRNADRICVLEHGAVTQQGTHDELVAADGLYRDLWRLQTGEADRR